MAASAGAGYNIYSARNNLFLFDGTPNAEYTLEELEQAIYQEIEKLQNKLVSEKELKRVKAQTVASEVYQQDSVQRQAYIIGSLETVGLGWQTMNEYADNIQKITAEDVREVARKYLVPDYKTVAILTPLEREGFGAK